MFEKLLTSQIQADDYSLGIRFIMWKATSTIIQKRPLSGVGAGAWESDIPLYQAEGSQLETDYYVHNEFLQLLAEYGLVGWVFRPLDAVAMVEASKCLLGEHDFSAFRSADCQAPSPIKTLHAIAIWRRGNHWCFDFHGSAFLHHMIRNLMGCFIAIGTGRKPPTWMAEVLAGRNREHAAPTFPADGLYFVGPQYDAHHGIPQPDLQLPWMGEPP